MSENNLSNETTNVTDSVVKDIANVLKKATTDVSSDIDEAISISEIGNSETSSNDTDSSSTTSAFRVCSNTLPAKPSVWTKMKNVLLYEIKVELTPYQQKIEDEINEFLHKEITWKNFKAFWLQEVKITL